MAFNRSGSVSHGTLKSEDLIPAFLSELKDRWSTTVYTPLGDKQSTLAWNDAETRTLHDGIKAVLDAIEVVNDEATTDAFWASDWASETTEELIVAIGEDVPPFVYFGMHPGDGSDFGYWFDSESFESSVMDGETLKITDASEMPRPKDLPEVEYVALVNDHGNVTLYTRKMEILYSIV